MALREFMERLCEDVEIPPDFLENPKEGQYAMPIDDETRITVSQTDEGLYFFSNVFAPPNTDKENFFMDVLEGNLFAQGTFGATLGLNETATMLTLSEVVSDEVSFNEFKDKFEDFLNTVKYWQDFAKNKH